MRRGRRVTLERLALNCLDVRELKRLGVFKHDCILPTASWRWPRLNRMRVSKHTIELELHRQAVPQTIRLSWTKCFFGGERPWLHCPHCLRRAARLFRGMGGYFCRACLNHPPYEGQRRGKKARIYLKAIRLRQKLDGSRPVIDPLPSRPGGMRRKTYEHVCAHINQIEGALIGSRVLKQSSRWIPPLAY